MSENRDRLPAREARSTIARAMLASGASVAGVLAQCDPRWLAGEGVPGVDGSVHALTVWDPDGAGPAPPRLVLGGQFQLAGSTRASNVATYEPVSRTWAALGTGLDGVVLSLTATPNGDLVAGGAFRNAGGLPANFVARWNGTAWSALGSGLDGVVHAMTGLPNGDLIVGGWFITAGGAPAYGVARWDGSRWWSLGSGMNGAVESLATLPNGDVVAGGWFSGAGGVGANFIARWNGTAWSPLGSGMNHVVRALTVLPGGQIVAGGEFTTAGGTGASRIARWNGSTWSALGTGASHAVTALVTSIGGDVVAAGVFTSMGNTSARHVARWNGTVWSAMGAGAASRSTTPVLRALVALPDGSLVAGGSFESMDGVAANSLARYAGATWAALGAGLDARVRALAVQGHTRVIVGGDFAVAGGVPAAAIASWDGRVWSALGAGMDAPVVALCAMPDGTVIAGGWFSSAGGVAAQRIARWNGSAWSPMASGVASAGSQAGVLALARLPGGDIVAGGIFSTAGGIPANNIARWDGATWAPLGGGLTAGGSAEGAAVHALAVLPDGDVVAAGSFTSAGEVAASNLARWDGRTWTNFGPGVWGTVHALAVLPNGDLVAGGTFAPSGIGNYDKVARWDGTAWHRLGTGVVGDSVQALHLLPDGDLVVGGEFVAATGVIAHGIARWDGTRWSGFGWGMAPVPRRGGVGALATLPSGDLLVGGEFYYADGLVSARLARLAATCPARVATLPSGCAAAAPRLYPQALPWIGSTFTATCDGLGPNSIGLGVLGQAVPATPLRSLHPAGAPGCLLLASLDAVLPVLPVAGVATLRITIPDDAALVRRVVHQQVLAMEPNPQHPLARLSSSDALVLTLGSF